MSANPCPHENEIRQLAASGQWPHACPADLTDHLRSCRTCADLLMLEQAFREDRRRTIQQAAPPAPGTIWWRAQLRRRSAALESIDKPIVRVQIFTICVYLLAAVSLVAWQSVRGLRWLDLVKRVSLDFGSLIPFSVTREGITGSGFLVLLPILGGLALLCSVLIYVVSNRIPEKH